jgi:hypothetical protein
MESISVREASRRLGVHHAAVQKRIKGGTLKALPDGKLDWSTVERQWTKNRDESKVRKPVTAAVVSESVPVHGLTLVSATLTMPRRSGSTSGSSARL